MRVSIPEQWSWRILSDCTFQTFVSPQCVPCAGDLNLDGSVTVDELVRTVGSALDECPDGAP